MSTVTTEQMNEAIARFMGIEPVPCGTLRLGEIKPPKESMAFLNYHERWELLMPVVDKIEGIHDDFHGYFGIHISSNSCCIQGTKLGTRPGKEHYAYFNEVTHETKLSATHYAIYQFITWYNSKP